MPHKVCPWWLGYFLASPLRRLWQHPAQVLSPYIKPGMTVLEPGPGMGFFTLELARQVGASGRIVVVDIQPRMLGSLRRRAARAGVADRLDARLVQAETMALSDLAGAVDFVVAIAVVHELPDARRFFREAAAVLKSGGEMLLVEPSGHVKAQEFDTELQAAGKAGLSVIERPSIRRSQAALLRKR